MSKNKTKAGRVAKAKKKMQESGLEFFVGIPAKDNFRAQMLNIQQRLLEGMRRAERFRALRQKKLQEIDKLKLILQGIIILNDKFRQQMPKVKIKLGEKKVEIIEPPKSVYDYSHQLAKLEKAITDIELKLKEFEAL